MRARGGDSGSPGAAVAHCLCSRALSSCAFQNLARFGYDCGRRKHLFIDLARLQEELRGFYARRLPAQEAEDFAQGAITQALERGCTDRSLVFKIANDLLIDEYRRRERQPYIVSWEAAIGPDKTGLDHLPQFQSMSPQDALFGSALDRAVRELETDPRDAFILGELRGLTTREAGAVLGTSHVTARVRRDAATTYIRKELTA